MSKFQYAIFMGLCFVLSLGILCGTGCKKNLHGTVPVTVKVMYNNAPVAEAVVVFQGGDAPASGSTNSNGVAVLSSFEPKDGAKPGKYNVTVSKVELKETRDPKDPMGDRILKSETIYHIPAVYGNAQMSELKAEVVAGKKNTFTFELDDKRKDAKVKIDNALAD